MLLNDIIISGDASRFSEKIFVVIDAQLDLKIEWQRDLEEFGSGSVKLGRIKRRSQYSARGGLRTNGIIRHKLSSLQITPYLLYSQPIKLPPFRYLNAVHAYALTLPEMVREFYPPPVLPSLLLMYK